MNKKIISFLLVSVCFFVFASGLFACGDLLKKTNEDDEMGSNKNLEFEITYDNGISYSVVGYKEFFNDERDNEIVIPSTYNGRPVTSIGDGAFYCCISLTSIEIPLSVTSIGSSAFFGCRNLSSLEIPPSVTSIGNGAFSECSSLTSIEIPSSVTSIGDRAFSECSSFTSIKIPEGVRSIGSYAFKNCSRLRSIEIPSSVTIIGYSLFSDYNSRKLYYYGTSEQWSNITIYLGNQWINRSDIYYYSETLPTEEGNYWYYDENNKIVIWP